MTSTSAKLSLSVPIRLPDMQGAFPLQYVWQEHLESRGWDVARLGYCHDFEVGYLTMREMVRNWRTTIQGVGGLVVACYNAGTLPWTPEVLEQVGIATKLNKPVFTDAIPSELSVPTRDMTERPAREVLQAANIVSLRGEDHRVDFDIIRQRLALSAEALK